MVNVRKRGKGYQYYIDQIWVKYEKKYKAVKARNLRED